MNPSIPQKLRRPAADRERGHRIKALRAARRESQAAFGDHFGVEQATVSRWEKGEPVKRQLWETMAKLAKKDVAEFFLDAHQTAVPLLSWVSAGGMQVVSHSAELSDAQMIPASGLGNGDWFALSVEGDSMDRIAPSGSIILVNRAEKTLLPRKFYIFFEEGEATFKRYADNPLRLEPFSTNPAHEAIFPGRNLTVIGRVRRVLIEI